MGDAMKALILASCVALSGCGGMSYAMEHYGNVPIQNFQASTGTSYRIFDKPNENRLMITSSIGGSLGGGAVSGFTLGAVQPASAEVLFRDAAEQYLTSTGRNCRSRDISLVVMPQYEVRYECSEVPAESDA